MAKTVKINCLVARQILMTNVYCHFSNTHAYTNFLTAAFTGTSQMTKFSASIRLLYGIKFQEYNGFIHQQASL